jgi:hypothetical protein
MEHYVLARVQAIQQELEQLRRVLAHQVESDRRKTKLAGLWKDVQVSEEDLREARRAVFKAAYEFDG